MRPPSSFVVALRITLFAPILVAVLLRTAPVTEPQVIEKDGVTKVRLLPPGPGNPRNWEGAFLQLKDGRLLFVYTHFTGGGSDAAAAHLAARSSRDGGRTWTRKDELVLPNTTARD